MIDCSVVYDKLAGFETADEIAHFLQEHNIQGRPVSAAECPLSELFRTMTGNWTSFGTTSGFSWPNYPEPLGPTLRVSNYNCTEAMSDFIIRFDRGEYPHLVGPHQ